MRIFSRDTKPESLALGDTIALPSALYDNRVELHTITSLQVIGDYIAINDTITTNKNDPITVVFIGPNRNRVDL